MPQPHAPRPLFRVTNPKGGTAPDHATPFLVSQHRATQASHGERSAPQPR